MRNPITKVVIIKRDMNTITFEKEGYRAAALEIARMSKDHFYNLRESDSVFIGNGEQSPSVYSVGELCRDVEG